MYVLTHAIGMWNCGGQGTRSLWEGVVSWVIVGHGRYSHHYSLGGGSDVAFGCQSNVTTFILTNVLYYSDTVA